MRVPLSTPRPAAAALSISLVLASASCEREKRRFSEPGARDLSAAIAPSAPANVGVPPHQPPYEDNAWAAAEGKRLFVWFNCAGCHGMGGGGMGPPLLDDRWRYGSAPEDVFTSIADGRPNGMPAFRGKIPDPQIWQLVAYVRSMSGLLRMDVAPGRSDDIQSGAPESMRSEPVPRQEVPHP